MKDGEITQSKIDKKVLPITSMSAFCIHTEKDNCFLDDPSRRGDFNNLSSYFVLYFYLK